MRRLLEADMKRVVAKVLPWIFLVAACVYVAADLKIGIGSAPDRVFFFLAWVGMATTTASNSSKTALA